MLTLLTTIQFIVTFLEGRAKLGDEFFFDEKLTEPINNISEFFGFPKNSEPLI